MSKFFAEFLEKLQYWLFHEYTTYIQQYMYLVTSKGPSHNMSLHITAKWKKFNLAKKPIPLYKRKCEKQG